MARERVGIMGGSFNPIHERHMEMAVSAMKEGELSRVLFLPTGNPPHKHEGLADAEDRFEMTRLAVMNRPGFSASRMELDRPGVIYTVDTLGLLKRQMPEADLFYLIGEDTMRDLPNWRTPDRVFALCDFLVCRRDTDRPTDTPLYAELASRGARMRFLSLPPRDVSSTTVREAIAGGGAPLALPPQVMEYVRIMGLYGTRKSPAGADAFYPRLRERLSEKRLLHSLLVSHTARGLAARYGIDEDAAALAALLHDCAKCMPLSAMREAARQNRLLLDRETLQSENLLHGPVGAVVAERDYGVTDPNVLCAIRCHTTGRVGMLPLDMIIYLADKIEPSRRSYPALETVRGLARESLTGAVRYCLQSTLAYVQSQGRTPHPTTKRTLEWLERMEQNEGRKEQ